MGLKVAPCPLPGQSLLQAYARNGDYTDCFAVDIGTAVSHSQFVAAFYTTWVFKLERFVLACLVRRPSTDEGARQLAAGADADFAAWRVEKRATDQLLMCDFLGRTRSWLMVEPLSGGMTTRLYFGSAVVATKRARAGTSKFAWNFNVLLGFHKLYSRILLGAARRKIQVRSAPIPKP